MKNFSYEIKLIAILAGIFLLLTGFTFYLRLARQVHLTVIHSAAQ